MLTIAMWIGIAVVWLGISVMLAGVAFVLFTPPPASRGYGVFHGKLQAELLDGAELMRLVSTFSYTNPSGKRTDVPAGYQWDGASIPRMFWRLVGHPFLSSYRRASLIHDWHCEHKDVPWRDAAADLYYACRLSGVPWWQARRVYAAVRRFGPKW